MKGVKELPRVVMDECREPVQGVIFETPKASDVPASGGTAAAAGSSVKTLSMLNWETPRENMPAELIGPLPVEVVAEESPEELFTIDEVDIFVAVDDDFFVVL